MAIAVGIVGLPNVGKSTLFNALSAGKAQAANFPFCTIEPNVGTVPVPDPRLSVLAQIHQSVKVVPALVEFVDIAGLVKGAASGEGLGNQFLSHIAGVDAIAHVVRCFEDGDVVHVEGTIDPLRDLEMIETELLLKDLETVERRRERREKQTKAAGKAGLEAKEELPLLAQLAALLEQGQAARSADPNGPLPALAKLLGLLTAKPAMLIANVQEDRVVEPEASPAYQALQRFAQQRSWPLIPICAALEAEVAALPADEQPAFLEAVGLKEPGLAQVIRCGYQLLDRITYFTAGPTETHAWTIARGTKAPEAAGTIHTDFQRGFIRAEVMAYTDLQALKSEQAVRQAGKLRVEGKDYVVADGDVMHFRFNV